MQFTIEAVCALKGAPLSILFVMMMANQPLSASYLEAMTGYSDKSVSAGLRRLEGYGYITRNGRYNWQLAIDVSALPLMCPTELLPEENNQSEHGPQDIDDGLIMPPSIHFDKLSAAPTSTGERYDDPEKFRVGEIPGRKFSGSPIDSWLVNNQDLDLINQQTNYGASESEKFRVDEPSLPGMEPNGRDETLEKYRILDSFGIWEPKRSKIAQNPKYSLRLVTFHCETAPAPGLMIYRIEHCFRVPASWREPWNEKIYSNEEYQSEEECRDTYFAAYYPDGEQKLKGKWKKMLEALQEYLPRQDYVTWCKDMQVVGVSTETVTVRTGNEYAANWLREHVVTFMQDQLGMDVEVIS